MNALELSVVVPVYNECDLIEGVLTEWAEFRNLDPEVVGTKVRGKRMLDGRLCLDPVRWRDAGWTYRAPGRP